MNYRSYVVALICLAVAALAGCEPTPKPPKATTLSQPAG